MSPSASALLIPVGPDEEELTSNSIQLASELDVETNRRDRRVHRRLTAQELKWVRSARLSGGHAVSLVDLSPGGALLDSPVPLRPDSILTLTIEGREFDQSIPFRVVRCHIGALLPERTLYRGACEFRSAISFPVELPATATVVHRPEFAGLDASLKQLVERAGSSTTFGSLDARTVRDALESLREHAIGSPLDPMGRPLAALLGQVVPSLDGYAGLEGVIYRIESQLRQTIPQVSLRLVNHTPDPPLLGKKSILVNVPGAAVSSALVSIDLPRGVVLNDWQARMLRVATRLIALLQRLEPEATTPRPEMSDVRPSVDTVEEVEAVSGQTAIQASAWQKIVVRYTEGQILKGYTHDFSPARQQFSLWPSLNAASHERVIVPLARLKGVFFVRDFAGNPGYVERVESAAPQHGRRIEVTLVDDEVIVGTTLSYRPDGHGFFVIPTDPLANNIRIFIVASSVRQVRFP